MKERWKEGREGGGRKVRKQKCDTATCRGLSLCSTKYRGSLCCPGDSQLVCHLVSFSLHLFKFLHQQMVPEETARVGKATGKPAQQHLIGFHVRYQGQKATHQITGTLLIRVLYEMLGVCTHSSNQLLTLPILHTCTFQQNTRSKKLQSELVTYFEAKHAQHFNHFDQCGLK